jgi:hypothetical protein
MFYINNMTQMSCNFKEQSKIERTGGIPLWGRGASRWQPKPPPPPCEATELGDSPHGKLPDCVAKTPKWVARLRRQNESPLWSARMRCQGKGGPEPIKRRQIWSPVLSQLHSILQTTSLWRTVYTRTKLATTAHVEQ